MSTFSGKRDGLKRRSRRKEAHCLGNEEDRAPLRRRLRFPVRALPSIMGNAWFLLAFSGELGYFSPRPLRKLSGPVRQPALSVIRAMNEPLALCNLLLILVTVAVSYAGFRDPGVEEKYIFRPESILAGKEYYRLVTSAFLHAGWAHLAWNMVSLYLFGRVLEWRAREDGLPPDLFRRGRRRESPLAVCSPSSRLPGLWGVRRGVRGHLRLYSVISGSRGQTVFRQCRSPVGCMPSASSWARSSR